VTGTSHTGEEQSPDTGTRDTRELILLSARQVIITHGYGGFTMRRVAEASGISLGNLTYHFPMKRALFQALVAGLVASYSDQFEELLSSSSPPFHGEFEPFVRWLLRDSTDGDTVRLFREMWALSLRDDEIAQSVDDFYDEMIALIERLIRRARPDASEVAVREVVHLLALMSEGSAVIYGLRPERAVPVERLIELVTAMLESAASGSSPANAKCPWFSRSDVL